MSVTRIPQGLRVKLVLGPAATTVQTVYEAFDARPDEHFLGTGERRDFGRPPRADRADEGLGRLRQQQAGAVLPQHARLRGALRNDLDRPDRVRRVQGNGSCAAGACEIATGVPVVQACFKTAPSRTRCMPERRSRSSSRTPPAAGRPPLPDPSQFAVTKWRDEVAGAADLRRTPTSFKAAGIPLGWVIIDNPWEAATCVGSMRSTGAGSRIRRRRSGSFTPRASA